MNIKEYYKSTAIASLNLSIFTAILSIIIFVIMSRFLFSPYVWETTVPFMILSCVFFVQFHLNKKRYLHFPEEITASERPFMEEKSVLMMFLPAPTLRIMLFNPKGQCVGEVKDDHAAWYKWFIPNNIMMFLPQKYILLDEQQNEIATFKMLGFLGGNIAIFDKEGKKIGVYNENFKKSLFRYSGTIFNNEQSELMQVNVSGYLHSFSISSTDGRELVSFQKGYMPLEWSSRFKQLNTPILSFAEETTNEEKICIYALCAKFLNYTNN